MSCPRRCTVVYLVDELTTRARDAHHETVETLTWRMSVSLFNQSFTGDQLGAMLAAESDAASSRRSCEELAEKLKVLAAEKFALKRALQEANAREAELGKHLDAELAMRLQMEETAKAK